MQQQSLKLQNAALFMTYNYMNCSEKEPFFLERNSEHSCKNLGYHEEKNYHRNKTENNQGDQNVKCLLQKKWLLFSAL